MAQLTKIIVGLGNPGDSYAKTRHNIGFMALDTAAATHKAEWKPQAKFKAIIATVQTGDVKLLLVKAQTFYNATGEAVQALAHFYKVPAEDIAVVHDELALPFGTVRTRQGGSDAGNNGIKSISSHMGADYTRIRIGIQNELTDRYATADFVLAPFLPAEIMLFPTIFATTTGLIEAFANGQLATTTHRH